MIFASSTTCLVQQQTKTEPQKLELAPVTDPRQFQVNLGRSQGRPNEVTVEFELDGYRGEYRIEDTRKALIGAKCKGIHPYCITIDKEAADYL